MPEKEINLIERFFQLDLKEEELQSFQKRLESDPDFKIKVDQYQFASKTAHELFLPGYQDILEKQKADMRSAFTPKEVRLPSKRKWWIGLAAAIALLLTASYFLLPNQNNNLQLAQQSAQDIAMQAVNVDALNNKGTRSSEEEDLHPVLEAYQNEEFEKVIELSNSYIEQADILLLRGLSLVKNNQPEEAIDNFKALLNLPSGQKDTALWWLASIYLSQENTVEAKKYLQQIIDGKYPSAKKASEIMNQT